MHIKVMPDDKMYFMQHQAEGEHEGEAFTYGTTIPGGMPVVLYRGRYAMLDIGLEELMKESILAIDNELDK